MIPVLTTQNLTLGAITPAFVEAFATFARSDRSRFLGGPSDDPRDAWESSAIHAGHWVLRGYGGLQVTETATGAMVGRVAIWHPGWLDEPELSWVVFERFEGRGFAYEAAVALRDWFARAMSPAPLMSLIAPENTRSIALAQRLGALREGTHTYESGKTVERWRHPAGEVAA